MPNSSAMPQKLANAALVVLAICAVVLTALVVRREFIQGDEGARSVEAIRPAHISDWRRFGSVGHRFGPATAPVTIVEFSDFQCPYCRIAWDTLRILRARYPTQVTLVYRHYPLQGIHPRALEAASAAECAGAQGLFERFHDVLFHRQESLSAVAWEVLAEEAEVPNRPLFLDCIHQGVFLDRIARDIRAGDSLGVLGTPTLLVNDTRFAGMPPLSRLEELVQEKLGSRN